VDDGQLVEVGYVGVVAVDEAVKDGAARLGGGQPFQLAVAPPIR